VKRADVNDKLVAQGLEASGMSTAEFAAYIKADIAKWKKVISEAKIPLIGGGASSRRTRARQHVGIDHVDRVAGGGGEDLVEEGAGLDFILFSRHLTEVGRAHAPWPA